MFDFMRLLDIVNFPQPSNITLELLLISPSHNFVLNTLHFRCKAQ